MVLGCAFMVFSGVIVLVDLKEVGFALSLLLCGGGWGVWGLRGGVGGGWCFPFRGSLGGFPSEGSRMGLLCLLWGVITGNHKKQCLVNSKPVEAFEMSFTKLSPLPRKC